MIIGREYEVRKLNEYYNSKSAELIALYGRRRVGKRKDFPQSSFPYRL